MNGLHMSRTPSWLYYDKLDMNILSWGNDKEILSGVTLPFINQRG